MLETYIEPHIISHPLISSLHIQKDAKDSKRNVLILETRFPQNSRQSTGNFDSYLMDLLADLEDIKYQAEFWVGKFDHVDIRLH